MATTEAKDVLKAKTNALTGLFGGALLEKRPVFSINSIIEKAEEINGLLEDGKTIELSGFSQEAKVQEFSSRASHSRGKKFSRVRLDVPGTESVILAIASGNPGDVISVESVTMSIVMDSKTGEPAIAEDGTTVKSIAVEDFEVISKAGGSNLTF